MISIIEAQPAGIDLVAQVEEIFSPSGVLSKSPNFEYRPQQQQMAVAVARALVQGEHLAVEAGTGVGKSLAYLIPSILFASAHRKKAVVSTHTINLQEQLFDKDLPMLQQILPVKFSYTMLKGRGNYLCTHRLHKALRQADSLFTSPEVEELRRIAAWAKETADGSLSDFEIEPDPKVWASVCSERGLCSPKVCGSGSDFAKEHGVCFFQRARQRILSADVLVLNHTLFFTLLAGVEESIKRRPFVSERLPGLRRSAHLGTRGLPAHWPERLDVSDAVHPPTALQSKYRERAVDRTAPRPGSGLGERSPPTSRRVFCRSRTCV